MIASTKTDNAVFSSEVRLNVELDGQAFPVSAVGPERFVLVEPQVLTATEGELIITVNGKSRRSASA